MKTCLFIKKKNSIWLKINFSDIVAIEAKGDYARIHTSRSDIVHGSMKKFEEFLPDNFFRCQRGWIVNTDKIKWIDHVTIKTDYMDVPTTQEKRAELLIKMNLINF